jgi:hypothetical protein
MPPLNPKCTGFCTGGDETSKGHRPTGQADVDFMRALLDAAGIEAKPSAAAVHLLYRQGYGYHAVADALGISHREGFTILTGQTQDFTWNGGRDG